MFPDPGAVVQVEPVPFTQSLIESLTLPQILLILFGVVLLITTMIEVRRKVKNKMTQMEQDQKEKEDEQPEHREYRMPSGGWPTPK